MSETISRGQVLAAFRAYLGQRVYINNISPKVIEAAVGMLEAEEPAEPHQECDRDDGTWYYGCGSCHQAIDYKDAYCRHCGRKVKWE